MYKKKQPKKYKSNKLSKKKQQQLNDQIIYHILKKRGLAD